MKIYRTTCYTFNNDERVAWVRYGIKKISWAAAKGVTWGGKGRRVTLESVEVPEDAWVMEKDEKISRD